MKIGSSKRWKVESSTCYQVSAMKQLGVAPKTATTVLANWETRGLDQGLAGETSVVNSLDLFGAICEEKMGSWEEQEEVEGTEGEE